LSYVLGSKSLRELRGVHPRLVDVVGRAIQITPQDFGVHDGLRTPQEQREYLARGVSDTMNSKHLPQASGFGHAVDLVPYVNGKLRWEWPLIYPIAHSMRQAAIELDVRLVWGGVWDRVLNEVEGDLEDAVEAYVQRRRSLGHKRVFIDGPHYQLA
jgi:peptidoglycan L-alanyl-D-glutamate endopeptidase CwlK